MASVEHEDNLLNTRTGIFLAINTILIAAIGKEGFKIPFVVEVLGFIITMFWFKVALFNRNAIIKAHGYSSSGKLFNPTDILAIWLPVSVALFWVTMIFFALLNNLTM